MKLWKKIALLCGGVLIAVVSINTYLVMEQTRDTIISASYEQVADKQRNLAASFQQMASYHSSPQDSEAVEYALVHYCFSQLADEGAVLIQDREVIYSGTVLEDYERILEEMDFVYRLDELSQLSNLSSEPNQQQFYLENINDRNILVCGSTVFLQYGRAGYGVCVAEDITHVYEMLNSMTEKCLLIGLFSMSIALIFIICLVRMSLRPLVKLQNTAVHIAEGSYGERAEYKYNDEIGKLADSFNGMAASIEDRINELTETTERQKMFVHAVTHEFKTPVTAILLNADTLIHTFVTEEEQQEALIRIEKQCRWMERLVQKLLLLTSLQNGETVEIVRCQVDDLLDQVLESTQDIANRKGITVEVRKTAESIWADYDLIQSVLINLVDNAVRASEEGQKVIVSVNENSMEVKDFGKGIAEEELKRIREPFYMVDRSRNRKYANMGLGLALADQIVHAHQGILEIESTPGQGTTVRINLK